MKKLSTMLLVFGIAGCSMAGPHIEGGSSHPWDRQLRRAQVEARKLGPTCKAWVEKTNTPEWEVITGCK